MSALALSSFGPDKDIRPNVRTKNTNSKIRTKSSPEPVKTEVLCPDVKVRPDLNKDKTQLHMSNKKGQSRYEKACDLIRQGQILPTFRDLKKAFRMGDDTVRRYRARMKAEGLLMREGKSYVLQPHLA